jgi:methionyl-tRNA formyltransferase
MRPRAAFMGTPAFAVPCLRALCEVAEVPLVITQPDKPQGRGLALAPTPVKQFALERDIPVLQPAKARDGVLLEALREASLDFALVVAYGKILPADVLAAPRLGCLNVHASLLPRFRGAAPIQWAILSGDKETGVCLMQMDVGMDTGPVLDLRRTAIGENETGGELFERLSALSGELVRSAIPRFVAGELHAQAQPDVGVTHARMIEKDDGALDFSEAAQRVHDRVRALSPWPGTYTAIVGSRADSRAPAQVARGAPGSLTRIKVHETRVVTHEGTLADAGTVLSADAQGIVVACGAGALRLTVLQLEGKRKMDARAFLAGHAIAQGACFAPRHALRESSP